MARVAHVVDACTESEHRGAISRESLIPSPAADGASQAGILPLPSPADATQGCLGSGGCSPRCACRSPGGHRKQEAGSGGQTLPKDGQECSPAEEAGDGSRELPDDCLLSILSCLQGTGSRGAFSLVSRRCMELEAGSRTRLRLGPGLHPATVALARLANRFKHLNTIHFDYLGWKSSMGPQLGDQGLQLLVSKCTKLEDLSLSFCGFVTDAGMAQLQHCPTLRSLRLNFTPCITGRGLLSVVLGCPLLSALHVERCMGLRSSEWIEALGTTRVATGSAVPAASVLPGATSASAPSSPLSRAEHTPLPEAPHTPQPPASEAGSPQRGQRGLSQGGSPWQPAPGHSTLSTQVGSSSRRASFSSSMAPSPAPSSPCALSPATPVQSVQSESGWSSSSSSVPSSASSCGRSIQFSSPLSDLASPNTPPGADTPTTPGKAPSPLLLADSPPGPSILPSKQAVVGVKQLTIAHCRGIGEGDLAKLGKAGWERLVSLRFELDLHPRDVLLPSTAPYAHFAPHLDLRRLRALSLSQCPRVRGEGLALVLARLCRQSNGGTRVLGAGKSGGTVWGPSELRLVGCPGLNDADVRQMLSAFSSSLRVLSLSVVKWLGGTALLGAGAERTGPEEGNLQPHHHNQQHQESTWAVTTASLWYIAEFCAELEELELICRDDFPSSAALFHGFADAAVADMVANLPQLRRLRVGKGLHLSQEMIEKLCQQFPQLLLSLV